MSVAGLSDELQGLIKGIGQAFLFAAYVPSLLFVALHQYAILPALEASGTFFPDVPQVPFLSGELLTTLLLPLFLGLLLVSLNSAIVKLFEGLLPWQSRFLRRWQQRNEEESNSRYATLRELKKQYRNTIQAIDALGVDGEADTDALYERLSAIAQQIQSQHEVIEKQRPVQRLPIRHARVCPTDLGNAFAVTEEYPLDRYGIDSVLFWPRLRQVVDDDLLDPLDNYKMFLDFQLNVTTLGWIFAAEASVVGGVTGRAGWWWAAVLALFVGWLSYRAAVGVARSMGGLITTCFDLYRGKLLEGFGLQQPTALVEEYLTWLRLGAFVRRGELQYWPGEL